MRHGIREDHEGTALALADMGVELKRLFEGHSDGRREAPLDRRSPEHQDIDAGIGLPVVPQRSGDASRRVLGVVHGERLV